MSQRYKGAVISATPPTVSATSPDPYGTAKGVWTLQQQLQYEGAGTWPSPFTPAYIEDVFSTYLYAGEGGTKTITNNIDLANKGGMVWIKGRDYTNTNHGVWDTMRGAGTSSSASKAISTNITVPQSSTTQDYISSFNANGFSVTYGGGTSLNYLANRMGANYVSWTFAKQPKFFDVVTYTGTGSAGLTINHNLGSVPGCIIIKRVSDDSGWAVYHRSLNVATNQSFQLNSDIAAFTSENYWNNTAPTATQITLGNNATVNGNGSSYVAYIFAHDAGGFGLTGTDNVISCGSFTTDSSGSAVVNLGYELQWGLFKNVNATQSWFTSDTMRGMPVGDGDQYLLPNTANQEASYAYINPTATGFTISDQYASNTYIYIAIRRGPMKTPTSGTSVFAPVVGSSLNSSFVTDFAFIDYKPGGSGTYPFACARLTGNTYLKTSATSAELPMGSALYGAVQNGIGNAYFDSDFVGWLFQRAPSFMDVVCYTGTGSARTVSHNLGVAPELIITKKRSNTSNWATNDPSQSNPWSGALLVNTADAFTSSSAVWNNTAPTSSVFTVGTADAVNVSGQTYVAYLFASCPGVSKVGSYTGTGTTQQINCGFTTGARFVLIKRTDSTGDWYVWDSARGIVSGNDPYLLLNSTAAEVTNTDYIDTYSAGFEISSTAPAAINANGGTFIYLAIA